MIVPLPGFVGLVLEIGGDSALGQNTEAVAYDVVLRAQGDAGVIHGVAAVLKQGDTGDALGDGVVLQDAQNVGPLCVALLLVGIETVRQGDAFGDGLEAGFVGGADLCQGGSGVDGLLGVLTGSLHSGIGGVLELILDGGDDHIQIVLDVRFVVVTIHVGAVPGSHGLFGGLGLFRGLGSFFLLGLFSLGSVSSLGLFRLGRFRRGLSAGDSHTEDHDQSQQDCYCLFHHFSSYFYYSPIEKLSSYSLWGTTTLHPAALSSGE